MRSSPGRPPRKKLVAAASACRSKGERCAPRSEVRRLVAPRSTNASDKPAKVQIFNRRYNATAATITALCPIPCAGPTSPSQAKLGRWWTANVDDHSLTDGLDYTAFETPYRSKYWQSAEQVIELPAATEVTAAPAGSRATRTGSRRSTSRRRATAKLPRYPNCKASISRQVGPARVPRLQAFPGEADQAALPQRRREDRRHPHAVGDLDLERRGRRAARLAADRRGYSG